jgi:hypothetical protein
LLTVAWAKVGLLDRLRASGGQPLFAVAAFPAAHVFPASNVFPTLSAVCPRRAANRVTKAKMAECQWLRPVLVGQFQFVEWTADDHLQHAKFVGLREDKNARGVARE